MENRDKAVHIRQHLTPESLWPTISTEETGEEKRNKTTRLISDLHSHSKVQAN